MPSRVTARAMTTCGSASWSVLAVAALAQRREQPSAPQLSVRVGFVDLEVRRGGVVEDQVDIQAQQVGAAQEHVAFDLLRPDCEEVERAVELIDHELARFRQPDDIGQPAGGTAQLRVGVIQALRRHGKQRNLMRGSQAGAGHAGADGLADAQLLPQAAGGQHDAEFEDSVDLDLGEGGFAAQGQGVGGIGIDDAVDAGDQALQGGFVDPIGAAEAVHHPHLGTLGGGVPDILGESVVGDGGAVAVPPLGDAQIHT